MCPVVGVPFAGARLPMLVACLRLTIVASGIESNGVHNIQRWYNIL